jgi:glycosyltransferase involved in cell wall biosynthesis
MKYKPETLVILSPGFPKNEADTTCITPQQIFVKALKEICPGLKIIVLSFHYPYHATEYKWHSVKVIPIGGKDKGQIYRLATWIKAASILKELNKQYRLIGLLSFWFGECALVANYFAKRNKLKHYSWLLGQDAKPNNKYFKWIKPQGDSLIALSDFIAGEIKRNYNINTANVIPLGIDTDLFRKSIVKRDIDILGAGSLIPLKQYDIFVEAIHTLKRFNPCIKAVICGNGPEMTKLKTLTASLGLTENLSFAGELQHKQVLSLMHRSKIFLHPANYEGFGSVISEALYAGAQVVSFTKPMKKDFRHHHVVKNGDNMNDKLISLLKDKNPGHDPVLMYPAWLTAKMMISLFID